MYISQEEICFGQALINNLSKKKFSLILGGGKESLEVTTFSMRQWQRLTIPMMLT